MNQERLLKILLAPHVSEKATMAAENHRQFVFQVAPDATKPEIKAAVEQLFEVEVAGVQIVNQKGKRKRFGANMGRRNNLKKAYVALKPGFDIDFMGAQ
ncbi:MAG TPA: 50S ribosomal protein L23 [Chromatiales bacterium]|nr:50S ribosomal protein L23 [Chromatiales bacterium]